MSNNYEVGYGKPPKRTRFRKGRSGNPKGRPKRTRTHMAEFEAELREKVMVREGDRRKLVTKIRATFKSLIAQAMKGNMKAVNALLDLIEQLELRHERAAGERIVVKNESARDLLTRRIDRLAQVQAEDKAEAERESAAS